MPEGPTIALLREEALGFEGKRVMAVEGNSKADIARLKGRVLRRIRTFGKELLLEFDGFAVRIHLLLFGKYEIDARKPGRVPTLSMRFAKGREFNFYASSVRVLDEPLDTLYDWRADVLNDAWDARRAQAKLRARPDTLVADALLDQSVFAGVGNIIKNEVLHRIRVHPESTVGALPSRKRGELVKQAREYSFDFYDWKQAGVLKRNLQVHAKSSCPRDGTPLSYIKHLGRAKRRAFWCDTCQRLYD